MPLGDKFRWTGREPMGRRRIRLGLIALNLFVAALLALLVYLVTQTSRKAYAELANDTAGNLATVVQANITSELSRVDALLQSALAELNRLKADGHASDAEINTVLESYRSLLPGVEGLRMTDAEGHVRWGNSLPPGPAVVVADRPFFLDSRDRKDGRVSVNGPVRSRVSDHWVVSLARPARVGDRFDGVLYATVAVEHFQKLFATYDIDDQDAVTLRTDSLQLVARRAPGSSAPVDVGSSKVSPDLTAALAKQPAQGLLETRTALDGITRITAYHRIPDWPFIVLAGLGSDSFYAPWREQRQQIALLAGVAWLLFAGATVVIYRANRRVSQSLRDLAASAHRTQALLRTAADGIHIIDRQGRLVAMSDSFARMLGSSREALMGRHASTWDANQDEAQINKWLSGLKDGDNQRVEVQHRRDDGDIIDVELELSATEIEGELFVYGSARDISERKRLLASIEQQSAQIRDLYDQAPCGYHSVDENGCIIHINATLLGWLGRTADQVLGRPATDFLDEASRAILQDAFPRMKSDGWLEGVEVRIVPTEGPSRLIRGNAVAVYDAEGEFLMSRTVSLDITLEAEAMEQVQLMLREQTAMLDNDIVGMARLRNRNMVWKNRAMDRIFGYEPGELDGQSIRMLYPDEESYLKVGAEAYPLLHAGQHYRTQLPMRHKDGRPLWIELASVRLTEELSLWTLADVTALKDAQARAEHLAFHDGLTGLPNRLLLADRIRQAIAAAAREQLCVAVCYLDLDGFKQVNDRWGHDAGDALLVEVGRRIQSVLRAGDTAARVGGDEFVVLLGQLEPDGGWRQVLDRLIQAIQLPVLLDGGATAQVGTSIGVAIAPNDGTEPLRRCWPRPTRRC